jgi:hypothetical protein
MECLAGNGRAFYASAVASRMHRAAHVPSLPIVDYGALGWRDGARYNRG